MERALPSVLTTQPETATEPNSVSLVYGETEGQLEVQRIPPTPFGTQFVIVGRFIDGPGAESRI